MAITSRDLGFQVLIISRLALLVPPRVHFLGALAPTAVRRYQIRGRCGALEPVRNQE
jgi:hypothetical protein